MTSKIVDGIPILEKKDSTLKNKKKDRFLDVQTKELTQTGSWFFILVKHKKNVKKSQSCQTKKITVSNEFSVYFHRLFNEPSVGLSRICQNIKKNSALFWKRQEMLYNNTVRWQIIPFFHQKHPQNVSKHNHTGQQSLCMMLITQSRLQLPK